MSANSQKENEIYIGLEITSGRQLGWLPCQCTKLSQEQHSQQTEASSKKAWHQRFTGNHTRKLLTGDGPQK
uniref:Uncharacterized protein n=1 Tax=Ditylenchus dipsaci TaxID=166011 RepID=A0A915DG35_9BILA